MFFSEHSVHAVYVQATFLQGEPKK